MSKQLIDGTEGCSINSTGTTHKSMTVSDKTDLPPASHKISDSDTTKVPHVFTKDLIVGTEGCRINDVIHLHLPDLFSFFPKNWKKVAVDLGIPLTEIEKLLNPLVRDDGLLPDKICKILECWVRRTKNTATLYELLSALINNGMEDLADKLESYFYSQHLQQHIIEIKVISGLKKDSSEKMKNINEVMYFPDKVIGTGFMGSVVFKGKFDPIAVSIPVAVKRINESSEKFIENEIDLLTKSKTIKNINILNLVGHEIRNSFYYLVLELCNANLKDWVEQTEIGMEVQGITDIKILSQCVSGLIYIHEKKVVHRNLKPSKIMLKLERDEVCVKLSGFGLGAHISKDDGTYTSPGPVGSPGWMAPEVSTSKKEVKINGAKADIFSLGCLFYYVVTRGGHPFGDKDGAFRRQVNIKARNIKMEPFSLRDSYGMTQLIELMIASESQDRPPLCANHPVFWSSFYIFRFFQEIEESESEVPTAHQQLQEFAMRDKVLGGVGWIQPATEKFNYDFRAKKYGENICDLIKAILFHFGISQVTSTWERHAFREAYLRKWLDLFPRLLPCAWDAFRLCKDEVRFQKFYSDQPDFGMRCIL